MTTQFPKIGDEFPDKWPQYFHAGSDWLYTVLVLDENARGDGRFVFYVYPHALYFSLELLVKSLAAYVNPEFDARKEKLNHSVTKIVEKYKSDIPLFEKIYSDTALMALIREFEKTFDTRFGETYIQTNRADMNIVLNTACEVRAEMCARTNLR